MAKKTEGGEPQVAAVRKAEPPSAQEVQHLSRIIIKAQSYAESDPEVALTQARKSAEAICRLVFAREVGQLSEKKNEPLALDELIRLLCERKIVPAKIGVPLRTIQAYGNFGTHAQSDLEEIDAIYAAPCFAALAQVTSWYFVDYLRVEIPAGMQPRGASTPSTAAKETTAEERGPRDPTSVEARRQQAGSIADRRVLGSITDRRVAGSPTDRRAATPTPAPSAVTTEQLQAVFAVGLTDLGRKRQHNEDHFLVVPAHNLYVVADGMGGQEAGDIAANMTTRCVAEVFLSTTSAVSVAESGQSEEASKLIAGIKLANRKIFDRAQTSRELNGMATTIVAMLYSPNTSKVHIAHVGDSRCYRIRRGQIEQLTRDHSLASGYGEIPWLTPEQRQNPPANVLTRALGMHADVRVDTTVDVPEFGDIYVLCSDGLSNELTEKEIAVVVANAGGACGIPQLSLAVKALVEQANDRGGADNITVILVQVGQESSLQTPAPRTGEEDELVDNRPTLTEAPMFDLGEEPGTQ